MTMASSINVITAALTSTAIRRISVIATKDMKHRILINYIRRFDFLNYLHNSKIQKLNTKKTYIYTFLPSRVPNKF